MNQSALWEVSAAEVYRLQTGSPGSTVVGPAGRTEIIGSLPDEVEASAARGILATNQRPRSGTAAPPLIGKPYFLNVRAVRRTGESERFNISK